MRGSSRAISLEAREGRPSTSISEYFRCAPRTSRSLRARKGAGNRLHGVGRAHASPETTPVHHAARRRGRQRAQQGERMRRIGVLIGLAEDDPEAKAWVAGFLQGLAKRGWSQFEDFSDMYARARRARPV